MNVLVKRARTSVCLGALCAFAWVVVLSPLRPAHAVSPRQLLEVTDIADVVVSPDGRSVAFRTQRPDLERNVVGAAWYVLDIAGKTPPRRVADGGVVMQEFWGLPAPAPAVWSPDSAAIYFAAMVDERVDVWCAAADGSGAVAVTLDPADVREFSLSEDGRFLTYSVGATRAEARAAEQSEREQGIRIDKTVPIGQPLFRSGLELGRPETQRFRDGKEGYRASLLADVPSRWKALDLVSGARRELDASEAPSSSTLVALPDGNFTQRERVREPGSGRILSLTGSGIEPGLSSQPPRVELAALPDGEGGRVIRCNREPCRDTTITDAQWRPGHQEVLFTVTDRDRGLAQSIYRWKLETDEVVLVVQLRGLVNGGRHDRSPCGVSASALLCVTAEADQPPRLERIDLETGMRQILFDPNRQLALDIATSTPAEFLRWEDASGQVVTAQFFAARRRDGRPPPLFVNYYSCSGFLRGGFGDEWPLASLAAHGISALCINYVPLKPDAVERYDSGLAAVRSAIDLLASAGRIDRSRVGMGGLSMGAEMTLWTVMNSDLVTAAAVSSAGQSPLGYELRQLQDDSYLPRLRAFWQLGSPDDTPERWGRLSLAFNVDKVKAPIMMQLPEREYIQTVDYAVPLIARGLAELYVFPNEAHNKFQPRQKLAVYQRNLDWFRFWLLGEEDPDRDKREQYVRWRTMKAVQDRPGGHASQAAR
jgi:dipeptidyl aminopeptidase/acylaminoacyl peptidase